MLNNVNAVLLFITTAGANASAFVPIFYVPLYFQFSRGDKAIGSAVSLLPLIFCLCAFIILNGRLMARFNYVQPWYVVGSALSLVGSVFMSQIKPNTPLSNIYGFEVLMGVGTGSFMQCGYAIIQHIVSPSQRPQAIGFMMLGQFSGIVLSLAIAGSIFINQALSGLAALMPDVPHSSLQQTISGTSGSFFRSLSPDMQKQSAEIIVNALAQTFIIAYVGAAICLVLSCCFTVRILHYPL
ncbi:hypothetical protein LX36DRAFT_715131 [Colletotrichum falcatum]|nr:hypothetical protein LX36DRAFT_715131 [Colletotrichum falcatum]